MTFFSKFRLSRAPAVAEAVAPTPAEGVEALRRRARHRLIGATVLVLLAVIVFPLVFDTQPRAIAVDVPIVIPDRNKAKSLVSAASAPVSAAESAEPTPVEVRMPASSVLPAAPASTAPEPKSAQPAPKAEAKTDTPLAEGQRSWDLLNGQAEPAAASSRFVVQLSAVYTDATKVREVRRTLEKAGLPSYAQALEPKDGQQRIRVRLGPFTSKAEVDKALSRVKGLDLPALILSL